MKVVLRKHVGSDSLDKFFRYVHIYVPLKQLASWRGELAKVTKYKKTSTELASYAIGSLTMMMVRIFLHHTTL